MNLRQFFTLLRQQRLFSSIYIVCTALSVALAMTLFLVVYIKFGPIYPEQDRARMAVVQDVVIEHTKNGQRYITDSGLGIADTLRNMPEVECVTSIANGESILFTDEVRTPGGEPAPCKIWIVDENYWQVFGFRFLHGRGITAKEQENFSPVCVVSESLARKAFGRTDVVGCALEFNDARTDSVKYIVGVVEDVSPATPMTYGNLWISILPDLYDQSTCGGFTGLFTQVALLRPGSTVKQLQQRMAIFQERYNQAQAATGVAMDWTGQPDAYWASQFRDGEHLDTKPFLRNILYMLLAFLMIPAINMGSMVASRVGGRINEMGIRRAYGATRMELVWQVLQENFLLTLIGGTLGLLISWSIMHLCADWLPFVFNSGNMELDEAVFLHTDMLFSGWVILAVLTICMVLNLVSALVPTLWFLRKPVTEEINHKLN